MNLDSASRQGKLSGKKQGKKNIPSHTLSLEKNFTFYTKKQQAIEHLDESSHLFSIDINQDGAKKFVLSSREDVYDGIATNTIENVYENVESTDHVKLFVDIDIKKSGLSKNIDCEEYYGTILMETIELINSKLGEYTNTIPQIIVLSANTDKKLSAHLIYTNMYFKSAKEQKFFFAEIDSDLIDSGVIDVCVYRVGCFRVFGCSKYDRDNKLVYFDGINYDYVNDKTVFMDSLVCNVKKDCVLIDYTIKECEVVKHKKINDTLCIINNTNEAVNINQTISLKVLQTYVDMLCIDRAEKYDEWLKVGICLRTCNIKSFDVWNGFSKRSFNYDSENLCIMKWNSFSNKSIHFGYLKKIAKEDSPNEYEKIEYELEDEKFKSKTFNSKYVIDISKDVIFDGECLVSKYVGDLMNGKFKFLAIKSPYGTGKTILITKILEVYKPQKVLFVTYRQTLANSFSGTFKKLGVKNYLDGYFLSDKIICQYDSLGKLIDMKLRGTNMTLDNGLEIPSYDLIILDEIESILNHSSASTIKNREKSFEKFKSLVYNAKAVIALDGDFFNRGYDFLSDFGKCVVLKNEYRNDNRHFIFMENQKAFDSKINTDLKNKLNICIVSMSSTLATGFFKKYEDKYKSVLHCSKSDDSLKKELKNVNEFWKKYQLVIFSPIVESGIDFNESHFDKIYVVLSSKSCSPRGLMQMCSRIRTIKDNNIHVFLNSIPFNIKTSFYKFNEVKDYVFSMFKKYFSQVVIKDEKKDKMVIKYKHDLWSKMIIYNEQESLNSNPYYFISVMLKMLKEKGCTYEYLGDVRVTKKEAKENKTEILKEELINAEEITEGEYEKLLSKQKNNNATHEDKIKIEKHIYKMVWKVDIVDKEFLDKYMMMTPTLVNLRKLIKGVGDKELDYYDVKSKEKMDIVKEIIKGLGFDNVEDKKLIKKEMFLKNREKVEGKCKLFTDKNVYYPMFGLSKKKIGSNKAFMGLINSLFKGYGFGVRINEKSIRKNNKIIKQTKYEIKIVDGMKDYLIL